MPAALPVLAFELGTLLVFVFAVISVISWILNQANAPKGPAPQRRPNQPPLPRNERIQQEIDRFLKEAAGGRTRQVIKSDEIEIVEPRPARRPPPPRRPPERPRPEPAKPAAPRRPGQSLATRHLTSSVERGTSGNSGSLRREQLTERLPHSIEQTVSAHLGLPTAAMTAEQNPAAQDATSAAVLQQLRTSSGMRTAIVLNEILQRPRALRR